MSMAGKLNVAFLWHMHQPDYRDPGTGQPLMPWVRLHGLKGYTDMLEAVRRFPEIRVTFNFAPVLVKQLVALTLEGQTDHYWDLTAKPGEELEIGERKHILRHFFSANWETMVLKYPRYRDLLHRRGRDVSEAELERAAGRFSDQDLRDLQVWFNLAWFGWAAEERHPQIREWKRKGRNFSEEDKLAVLQMQKEVLSRILPDYRAAWEQEAIEISASPFYHPILPLLVDSGAARICQPRDDMPDKPFMRPDDAREQLRRAMEYTKKHLGRAPEGLWPSEGSVSPKAAEFAGEAGFRWMATDEAVLMATLGRGKREEVIYQGYRTSPSGPDIVFRDRYLSDAIGFRYARNTAKQAVDDLLGHLQNIASHKAHPENHVAAVILDGENAWEYFSDGGRLFFEELYGRLSKHPRLRTATVGSYLKAHPPETVLPPLFPASWIRCSFRIWIGDPIKNVAWNRLRECGEMIDEYLKKPQKREAALRAREWLLVAEGSDWFWWYGEPNNSSFDAEFDQLFRLNLMQAYKELGVPVPPTLEHPIDVSEMPEEVPLFPMEPIIDGKETTFYEWVGARVIKASDLSGAMTFTTRLFDRVCYGLSPSHFFLRLDPSEHLRDRQELTLVIRFIGEGQPRVEMGNLEAPEHLEAVWIRGETRHPLKAAAIGRIIELAVPFDQLPRELNEIHFAVLLKRGDFEIERWPRLGTYACPWPTPEYLTRNWVI
ncbi:MAG: glycoside hydrolase family 57 [Candidatus Zixiibacteriota bacterium]|nr:MAG: glycoside hydrolase family 57 [candidate division Zixibacteria bacterium]